MTRLVMFDYDPNWPNLYEEEAKALKAIWQDAAISMHHVGSTSVPGLRAKPIIDIMIVIKDRDRVPDYNMQMVEQGYRCRGECLDRGGTPGRYYYSKDIEGMRTHQVHVMQVGHHDIQDKLDFRDYLRAHPDVTAEYASLKTRLISENTSGIMEYIESKGPFIRKCIKLAKEWRKAEQGASRDASGAREL